MCATDLVLVPLVVGVQIVCVVGTALVRSTPGLLSVGDVSLAIGAPQPASYRLAAASQHSSPSARLSSGNSGGSAYLKREGSSAQTVKQGRHRPSNPSTRPQNPYLRFVTSVSSIPAGLVIPHDVSLHVMLKVIGEARRGLQNMRQTLLLTGSAQVGCA